MISGSLFSFLGIPLQYIAAVLAGIVVAAIIVSSFYLLRQRRLLLCYRRQMVSQSKLLDLLCRGIHISSAASGFTQALTSICDEICRSTGWVISDGPYAAPSLLKSDNTGGAHPAQIVRHQLKERSINFEILAPKGVTGRVGFSFDHQPEERDIAVLEAIFSLLNSVYQMENSLAVLHDSHVNLVHAAKMASLGEMAGGIAHEVNNPLQILHAYITRIEKYLESDEPKDNIQATLGRMLVTIERISKIVNGLRAFARNGENDPPVFYSAKKILDETSALASDRLRSSGIRLKTSLESGPNLILNCRPSEVEQILLNLISNACDAVADSQQKEVEVHVRRSANGFCEFSVVDTGEGVAPEHVRKIMQPFFTTKPTGRGTGLGLSISRSIAQGHGGDLIYRRQDGRTTFSFTIPEVLQ